MSKPTKQETVLRLEKKTEELSAKTGSFYFNPDQFFQTKDGLYVWDDFRTSIVSHAKAVEEVPELNLSVFTLVSDANDAQIRRELPAGHVFTDVNAFCYHLAGMLKKQTGGTEGSLLNDGFANIFYVQGTGGVFAVDVRWNAGDREWDVCACGLDGNSWHAGGRVFSAAAVA